MDRLTGMKVFLAVADAASFSAAARALGVSKAMVSKHVAHLEDSLGVRLLQRSTRWMRLTEAGSTYQESCRRILADIDESERVVAALHAEPRGLLRVAAPTSLGSYHLAPAISDYTTLFPEVQVRLTLNDRAEDPIKECTDVVVRIGRLASSNLIARRIAEVRWVTCAAPVYLERFGVPQVPGDLARHNCLILYRRGDAGRVAVQRAGRGVRAFRDRRLRGQWGGGGAHGGAARARPRAARGLCGPTRHRRRAPVCSPSGPRGQRTPDPRRLR